MNREAERTIAEKDSKEATMLQGYKLFDADAHTMMSPRMWETLPSEYQLRRPRPTRVHDASDMGRWTNGWLVEGQIIPHALGPGSQPGNEPARVLEEFGAKSNSEAFPLSGFDLSDPAARLRSMDFMGVDHQMLFPTTLYARMTRDPGFEAALMRSYNRYVGQQCQSSPKRLKWAGLLPLRDARQGLKAIVKGSSKGDILHFRVKKGRYVTLFFSFERPGKQIFQHLLERNKKKLVSAIHHWRLDSDDKSNMMATKIVSLSSKGTTDENCEAFRRRASSRAHAVQEGSGARP
jgi:hypothetical protein